MEDKVLEIIKEESENANVRKYTCINGFGYSQFERNIAERVVKLFCQPVVSGSLHLVDFIEEIEYMQRLYSNARYTQAEATRDKLAEQLDDLMRLGSNDR